MDPQTSDSYPPSGACRPESTRPEITRPETTAPNGVRRRHLFALTGLAASLLVAFSFWASPRKYTWASMIEALEEQPWIQAQQQTGGVDNVRGWVSVVHRVRAVRSQEKAVIDDWAQGVRCTYVRGAEVLLKQPLESSTSPSTATALLDLLITVDDARSADDSEDQRTTIASRTSFSESDSTRILEQRWETIGGEAGHDIELSVLLQAGQDDPQSLQFVLDRKTRLPQTCRLLRAGEEEPLEILMAFPSDGPRDVHDRVLAVPADLTVVHLPQNASDEVVAAVLRSDVEVEASAADSAPAAAIAPSVTPSAPQVPAVTPATAVATDARDQVPDEDQTPPPTAEEMSWRIDELMATCWQENGIRPDQLATDAEYLRRLYLDLTGRIPTVSEAREFLGDDRTDRREHLLENLLGRYDHATHLAAVWRRFLLPDGVDLTRYGGPAEFERWLTDRFRDNVPYDDIVRELLLAEGRVNESGPLVFYTALKLQPEELASQTSRAFLGTRMECAQCHDHLFDDRWTQKDFWAYAAFFAQISRPEGKMEMVSSVMRIQDSTRGEVLLPESDEVISPRFPLGAASDDDAGGPSRRRRLAAWLTAPDNEHFARATVNRVWEHLFGKGLVDPVDDIRPDNPATCPAVLEELTQYFVKTGFDLRQLFRTIALTGAYQLSSGADVDDPSRRQFFAQMNVKSFTSEQLFDSIALATRLQSLVTADGDTSSVLRFNNINRQEFLEQFRAPPGHMTEYHAGIPQALTLMNGGLIHGATDLITSGILRSLDAPFFSDGERLETLFLATLARRPDDQERQLIAAYFDTAESGNQRQQVFSDVLWALLNSAEFTMNH